MLRWSVVLALLLATGCGSPRVVRLDTGRGRLLEYTPPTSNRSVEVGPRAFEEALTRLVLAEPLTLRPAQQGWLVRTSSWGSSEVPQWQHLARKGLGGLCKPGQPRDHCLSVLDDVLGLSELEKLGMALGMSFDPLRDSIAAAVQDTLAPQLFYSVIATGLVTWVVLAANPEPVFTKAAALVSAVMLIYLGLDTFLEVVKASLELKRATAKATTFEELEAASQRFAHAIGPRVARVFVLAVTVVVSQGMGGGAGWLASRLSMLPSYTEAAALGATQVGLSLTEVGQVSAIAVVEGNLVITLAPTAVAMAAQSTGGGGAASGAGPSGFRSWGSFSGLKNALGPAGEGRQWHHIVEQTPGNVQRFGPHALHNTENVIPLETVLHNRLSALYSSVRFDITNSTMTVRQWLSTQPLEFQRAFGLKALENIRTGVW